MYDESSSDFELSDDDLDNSSATLLAAGRTAFWVGSVSILIFIAAKSRCVAALSA